MLDGSVLPYAVPKTFSLDDAFGAAPRAAPRSFSLDDAFAPTEQPRPAVRNPGAEGNASDVRIGQAAVQGYREGFEGTPELLTPQGPGCGAEPCD